jgi:hypothetical protein
MMSILNNVTTQPPDHIKNTVVEIKLKIDAWIILILYMVAPYCIFTIVVGSASASIVINILKATCCTRPDQTRSSQVMVLVSGTMGYPNQNRPGTIFQTRETRQFTTS